MPAFNPEMIDSVLTDMLPYVKKTGIEAAEVEGRRVKLKMPENPANGNHLGMVHAAALYTLAESTGGMAMLCAFDMTQYRLVIKSATIAYAKPAWKDVYGTAEVNADAEAKALADIKEKGKADVLVKATLDDGAGLVLATADLLYNIRPHG